VPDLRKLDLDESHAPEGAAL
jgi:hypothetical protein